MSARARFDPRQIGQLAVAPPLAESADLVHALRSCAHRTTRAPQGIHEQDHDAETDPSVGNVERPETQAPYPDINEIKHIAKRQTVDQVADCATSEKANADREGRHLRESFALVVDQ